jgi:hypothetical protein
MTHDWRFRANCSAPLNFVDDLLIQNTGGLSNVKREMYYVDKAFRCSVHA